MGAQPVGEVGEEPDLAEIDTKLEQAMRVEGKLLRRSRVAAQGAAVYSLSGS